MKKEKVLIMRYVMGDYSSSDGGLYSSKAGDY
jgi:hypothetical protein